MVFVSQSESAGVILIRFPGNARNFLAKTIIDLVQAEGNNLYGAFIVVQPGHIRSAVPQCKPVKIWNGKGRKSEQPSALRHLLTLCLPPIADGRQSQDKGQPAKGDEPDEQRGRGRVPPHAG